MDFGWVGRFSVESRPAPMPMRYCSTTSVPTPSSVKISSSTE
jgi:hypothetical protein